MAEMQMPLERIPPWLPECWSQWSSSVVGPAGNLPSGKCWASELVRYQENLLDTVGTRSLTSLLSRRLVHFHEQLRLGQLWAGCSGQRLGDGWPPVPLVCVHVLDWGEDMGCSNLGRGQAHNIWVSRLCLRSCMSLLKHHKKLCPAGTLH